MSDDYKIGYGRPPKAHRFPKGLSGNPSGSSRKVRKRQRRQILSFEDLVLEDATKPIRIREATRTSTISLREALLQKQYAMALNGSRLSIKASLEKFADAEQKKREQILDLYEAAYDFKEHYSTRAKDRQGRGGAPLLPHGDDVLLNSYTGQVTITGPRNHEELATLKNILEGRRCFLAELEAQRSDSEESAREGFPWPPHELEIISQLEGYCTWCDEELARRGWLPRIAGAKEA